MFISEIFHSIQGEGELTGVPSIFIRTSGCNLRCKWCDTKYASWNPEGREMSIPDILSEIETFPSSHVVLTGGEPMIAKGIQELARALKEAEKHITIETAATIAPEGIDCDLASLSPKLSNSTPDEGVAGDWASRHERDRIQPNVIREWIERYPFQLKFVVQSSQDLVEIEELRQKVTASIPSAKILIMPEGIDTQTIRGRDDSIVDVCLRNGYRYCNRLHVEIFGNTRGT